MTDKIEAIERLNDLLNDKEKEIEKLKETINEFEFQEEQAMWRWTRHSLIKNDTLPVPRLQMEYKPIRDDGRYFVGEWILSMVYKNISSGSINVPLDYTRVSSGDSFLNKSNLPFRDGAHFEHAIESLGFPGYVIVDGKSKLFEVDSERIKRI